jgi:murein DD-endopeptidase MepM/ murein hydrolase activator NlpD
MIRLSLNLPVRRRLHVEIVRRREIDNEEHLLPSLESIKRIKKGSKLSRYFRHVFEHKNIKRILGANFALLIAASTIYPTHANYQNISDQNNIISQNVNILTTQKGVQYPVSPIKITQTFKIYHPGIDLDGITGDPVKPIMSGVVAAVDFSKYAYGNAVLVDHGNSITSLYAHLSKILVSVGDNVDMNTIIGLVGATGHAFGDHLHLEVRDHGVPFNPLLVLPQQ